MQDGSKVGEGNGHNSLMASAEERVMRENGFHRLLMSRALQLVYSLAQCDGRLSGALGLTALRPGHGSRPLRFCLDWKPEELSPVLHAL